MAIVGFPMRRVITSSVLVIVVVFALRAPASSTACDRVRRDLMPVGTAIELYRAETGCLPPEEGWLQALKRRNLIRDGVRESDPWGNAYIYRNKGTDFELLSIGRDGILGTADDQTRANGWEWSTCSDPSFFNGCGF